MFGHLLFYRISDFYALIFCIKEKILESEFYLRPQDLLKNLICLLLQGIYPTGVPGRHGPPSASARVAQPTECKRVAVYWRAAGEGNKRASELSQNMRPDREHMQRA